jgi:hypothetical protein
MTSRMAKHDPQQKISEVRAALDEAHVAAAAAVAEFLRTARFTPEGFVADGIGSAFVIAYNLRPRLRIALKSLGEIERGDRGAWIISNFSKHATGKASQSISANRTACEAARAVLTKHFPGEADFYAPGFD